MAGFRSNDELFQAVAALITTLEADGHVAAATEIRNGLGCVSGLTDGWALFLDSIEKVRTADAARLTRDQRNALTAIRSAVRRAVHRP